MRLLNILIFEPYPFGMEAGNLRTQSYILELVDKDKFNPIVLAAFESDFTNRIRKQGIECIVLKTPRRLLRYGKRCLKDNIIGKVLTIFAIISYNLSLLSIIKKKKIDLVYCNCIRGLLSVGWGAKLSRKPILWYIKGPLENKILDRIGFMLADKILFFCESNKNDKYPKLINRYEKKIDILKIGIDFDTVARVEKKDKTKLIKELSIDSNKVNVIFLGQLRPSKGISYLLEALALIADKFPNFMLYIVGHSIIEEYNNYNERLINIITEHRLKSKVIFTGWRSDALEILSLMDILVLPSLSEGVGRVALEAMVLGKALIASRVGGLREIIKDGENGFLVEPKDQNILAQKLSILLKDKELRDKFGSSAQKTILSDYLIEDKISRLQEIWSNMTSRKR